MRSKKEQREYKEFEQLFSVPVHCNHSDSHFIENIQNNRWLCISAIHMSEPIFTSQLKNKEKSIDAADSKGRPIQKYQMHVLLLTSMSKIWQGCPIPKCQMLVFCIHQWANFYKVFPFQNIKCLWLWNGQALVRVGPKQTIFNPFPRRPSEPSPSECVR